MCVVCVCVCVCGVCVFVVVCERERESIRLSEHSLSVETGRHKTELESQRAPTVFSLHRGTHRGRAALPYRVQQI